MILVDSSVWVEHLRGSAHPVLDRLRGLAIEQEIVVGDLILLEVLQGVRDEREAGEIERHLRAFDVLALLDDVVLVNAARHHRSLRPLGITVRKTIDMIIGTYCIAYGFALLQSNRDFLPMARHVGLKLA